MTPRFAGDLRRHTDAQGARHAIHWISRANDEKGSPAVSEENDTRKQIEDDQTEDLQLESEDADDVGQRSAAQPTSLATPTRTHRKIVFDWRFGADRYWWRRCAHEAPGWSRPRRAWSISPAYRELDPVFE